jgi:hypothetical protein
MTARERASAVRSGVADGLSHSEIGALYGCSRNASIGVAHRNGIRSLQSSSLPAPQPKPRRVPKPAKVQWKAPTTVIAVVPPTPSAQAESLRIRFVDRAGTCAWLDGERGADGLATCCGHPAEVGSWCGRHARLVYREAS